MQAKQTRQKEAQKPISEEMPKINPNAAGLDIGASEIWAAIPPGRDEESVREYKTFTLDLNRLADWLVKNRIDTVAMESTGVYWIPIFNILEERGMKVYLVNPAHMKQVPGRKSDVKDCQWIQQLHSFGLLSASFRPNDEVRVLRTLVRQRSGLVEDRTVANMHMHKVAQQMNLQLTLVVSDITGVTGMAILRDIVAGIRDPLKLVRHRDKRCAKSESEIAKALTADYRDELVFVLKQALSLYDSYTQLIADCDVQIARQLEVMTPKVPPDAPLPELELKSNSHSKNGPGIGIAPALYRITGVDLLAIPGFSTSTVQIILSEIGTDLSAFPDEKHFCSWLGLAPHNDISGGKVLRTRTLPTVNRVGQCLRLAAQSAGRGSNSIGEYSRRMKARIGPRQAIVATAHKLARILYRMLTQLRPYQDIGAEEYARRQQKRNIDRLQKQAAAMGYSLTPVAA